MRRLRRGLATHRRKLAALSGPLSAQALVGGVGHRVSGAWETSLWGKTSGLRRVAVMDRGRAVPLVWQVRAHGSAAVSCETDKDVLAKAKTACPLASAVVVLADRGCAATQWMGQRRAWGWHWRIRITAPVWRPPHVTPLHVGEVELQPGQRSCGHEVASTDKASVRATWASRGLSAARRIGR